MQLNHLIKFANKQKVFPTSPYVISLFRVIKLKIHNSRNKLLRELLRTRCILGMRSYYVLLNLRAPLVLYLREISYFVLPYLIFFAIAKSIPAKEL